MKSIVITIATIAAIGIYSPDSSRCNYLHHARIVMQYHFISGKTLSQAKDASSWEIADKVTDCVGPANLPCVITFNTATYPTLQDYLDSFSTVTDVKNAAISTRNL
jgi:hypothetical protein